jgi:hypothetical protein
MNRVALNCCKECRSRLHKRRCMSNTRSLGTPMIKYFTSPDNGPILFGVVDPWFTSVDFTKDSTQTPHSHSSYTLTETNKNLVSFVPSFWQIGRYGYVHFGPKLWWWWTPQNVYTPLVPGYHFSTDTSLVFESTTHKGPQLFSAGDTGRVRHFMRLYRIPNSPKYLDRLDPRE